MTDNPLEYVFSGCGHTRMLTKPAHQNPDVVGKLVDMLNRAQGINDHVYSALFNAHTEKSFGPILKEKYGKGLYKIHSDSGGLQIVTQGLDITEEMKASVYQTQYQYSDIAMSFDEIPVILTGETSNRNDVKNRLFDDSNFDEFAKQTGTNLRNQLEHFKNTGGSECKPLIIIQGNCLDSYCRWAEVIMKQIPDELVDGIGGVSLGAAGLGTGPLEDIERMFSLNELPVPDSVKSTLHILGVGSVRRLLPMLTFRNNGRLDGVHVSYDSTTHSSGLSLGNFYDPLKMTLVKMRKGNFEPLYNRIIELIGSPMSSEHIWDSLHMTNAEFDETHPGKDVERFAAIIGFMMASITNFTGIVNDIENDPRAFNNFIDSRKLTYYNSLRSVKTRADYDHWISEVGRHVKSARVAKASDSGSTVEEFF